MITLAAARATARLARHLASVARRVWRTHRRGGIRRSNRCGGSAQSHTYSGRAVLIFAVILIKFRRQISVQRRDGWIERAAARLMGTGRDRHGGAKFYLYDASSPLFSVAAVWLLEQMMWWTRPWMRRLDLY